MPQPWEMNWGNQQGGFTPLTGPDPMKQPELAIKQGEAARQPLQTQVMQGQVATVPADIRLKNAQATKAQVEAQAAPATVAATLAARQQAVADAQQKGLATSVMRQQQVGAQGYDRDVAKDVVLSNVDDALQRIKNPRATGGIGAILSHVPAVAGWATDANTLSHDLQNIGTNNAMLGILAQRANSPTGSTGLRVTQQEFKAFRDALGSLDMNQSTDRLQNNLNTIRNIWRNHLLRSQGIDPSKSKALLPTPQAAQKAATAPPPPRVINFHELQP